MSEKLSLNPNVGISRDHVIYVELDALLDTRLGTLNLMDPRYAEETVSNPGYFTRVSDDFSAFCGVSFEDYKAAYRARNMVTLENSIVTNASFVLNSVVNELNRQRSETPFAGSVTVEVNMWPYQPDMETRFELENAIAALLPMDMEVRSIILPMEDLTLQHVARHYSGMMIYNFAEWMQMHVEEFRQVTIPGVTVLAPKLHTEGHKAFESSDLGSDELNDLDPYEMITMFHAPLLGMELLEPHHFCMITQEVVDAYHQNGEAAKEPQGDA